MDPLQEKLLSGAVGAAVGALVKWLLDIPKDRRNKAKT